MRLPLLFDTSGQHLSELDEAIMKRAVLLLRGGEYSLSSAPRYTRTLEEAVRDPFTAMTCCPDLAKPQIEEVSSECSLLFTTQHSSKKPVPASGTGYLVCKPRYAGRMATICNVFGSMIKS